MVRSTPQWSHLPVLFLSGHLDSLTMSQAVAAGANDCVSKTVEQPELMTRICNLLERVRLLRGVADSMEEQFSAASC